MKKIFLVIIILLLTTACSNNLKILNLQKLEEKIEAKETFILYITNEDEVGTTLKNTLLNVASKNDLHIFYLNTNKLNDNELDTLKKHFYFEDENIIIFVNEGIETTVLARIDDAYITHDDLENELKLQGFIK